MAVLTAWLTGPVGRIVSLLMVTAPVLIVVTRRSRVVRNNQGSKRSKHG